MTFDFRFLAVCDHTIFEARRIEPDGRTIKVSFPIASGRVLLFRNGNPVRQTPLSADSIAATSVISAEFSLADLLFEVGESEAPIGFPTEVVNATQGITYDLTGVDKIGARRIKLDPLVGTNNLSPVTGDEVFITYDLTEFGWEIQSDLEGTSDFRVFPISSTDRAEQKSIRLTRPVQTLTDVWEVKYVVSGADCRKCAGVTAFDITLTRAGRLDKVRNEEKLDQDLRRLLLTILNSHPEHPWIGTSVKKAIGNKLVSRRR